jgi:hypothetical protein
MSPKELDQFVQSGGGLPSPGDGASAEERKQWFVATIFLLHLHDCQDKEIAKIEAANLILGGSDYLQELPYLEQALGRQLKPGELAARHIISVADLF